MNVKTEVLDVLSNAVVNENTLKLIGQIERKLYEDTNKVLVAAGGKWNRKVQAHIFEADAAAIMDHIILTGKVTDKRQELGYFPTPKKVVVQLLELAEIEPGMLVLEPSAGQGAIATEVASLGAIVHCVEVDGANREKLSENLLSIAHEYRVEFGDFLAKQPTPIYDRVVMNPPFAKQADVQHVSHAYKFLKPGGKLVAVMSAGVVFRTNRLTTEFRKFIEERRGIIGRLPEGSFAESGTGVNTAIVTLEA